MNRPAPLRVRIPADLETPVSVFLKLQPLGATFLFESVERGLLVGRYSFIGLAPRATVVLRDGTVTVDRRGDDGPETRPLDPADPFAAVRDELARQPRPEAGARPLPPASGGAVGYIGYDMVRYLDAVPLPERAGEADLPDYQFQFPGALAVFDHVRNEIEFVTAPESGDPDGARARAELDELLAALETPLSATAHRTLVAGGGRDDDAPPPEANLDEATFTGMVRRAQEHIRAGDAFQIVLSQRLAGRTQASPFRIYRALRILNPSPYLFYLDFGDAQLVGSSPEMLVRVNGGRVQVNPIAGTRPRGATPAADHALEAELLDDAKERAEHVMLVDLGRNDLGRVCRPGTVVVDDFMSVERYSHVMHIVSHVSGELDPRHDAFDVLAATFPAGTVSGAPKIRAMQIVSELEPDRRGPYAGAVGYFGRGGEMDMCIAIRTLVVKDGRYSVQAGAGIVADSVPAREYRETLDKARALVRAVANAEEGR